MNLHKASLDCLMDDDPITKQQGAHALYKQWQLGEFQHHSENPSIEKIQIPGRPLRPELVAVSKAKQRKLSSEKGRANLIHAICHIEFNAINLALDAVYRFRDMPESFYGDWLQVASEEAYHFSLLSTRLNDMGYQYGDMPAHNGLWESCINTDHDVMVRMALVPRVLEARGLDVTPGIMKRLRGVGDQETVDILKIILRDEIGHVKIGSHWFHHCCKQRQLDSESTFIQLINEYMQGQLRGPFHDEARLQAGFAESELALLRKLS
ncbi:MAG: ferritin-like domain-containing protein [Thiotrichaceae bacterium]|nr:ferritin-like domain-containing protein [Thiotrichaceae bacterium]